MNQSNDVDHAPEPIWPDAKLERQMLKNADICRYYPYSPVSNAGHHIPALLERVRVRVLEAEVARLSEAGTPCS